MTFDKRAHPVQSLTPDVVKGFSHSDSSSKNLYRPRVLTVSVKVASLAVRGCV